MEGGGWRLEDAGDASRRLSGRQTGSVQVTGGTSRHCWDPGEGPWRNSVPLLYLHWRRLDETGDRHYKETGGKFISFWPLIATLWCNFTDLLQKGSFQYPATRSGVMHTGGIIGKVQGEAIKRIQGGLLVGLTFTFCHAWSRDGN